MNIQSFITDLNAQGITLLVEDGELVADFADSRRCTDEIRKQLCNYKPLLLTFLKEPPSPPSPKAENTSSSSDLAVTPYPSPPVTDDILPVTLDDWIGLVRSAVTTEEVFQTLDQFRTLEWSDEERAKISHVYMRRIELLSKKEE
jgi:hypothetical protein